ncbi:restriction endonuclease subunit S [Pontibaca salina]|uniref:Restriction endonuclease subunit S n=1 Tax=Pontibaca salina TaxID=2795731 RepID=A0A934HT32_9RHOB|nr:restriction endonuclease subunit S [Pontibaca salina]MBI6630892.1 restriction endonuclease subunit S [Pontibaca salina]
MNIAAFPKYESYQDSGVKWIGKIPASWDVRRGKWLFKRMDRPVRPEDEIVTCFRDGMVTLRSNRRTEGFTNAMKEHGYQGIRKGDFVIHSMDAFAGAIGVSDSDGKSTPVYSACVPRVAGTVEPAFYAYYMRHIALSGLLVAMAKGIRERSTDFRFNDFADLALAAPPIGEQKAIVAFLDGKCATIDEAVRIKEEQIKLLRERRQILIQQAVTRGLNPDAPMKDSGIDWIGQIPAHWEAVPILAVGEVIDPNPSHRNPEYVDEGFPFISTQEFRPGGAIEIDTPRRVSKKTVEEQEDRCKFAKGSLVFSRKGTIGAVRVLPSGIRLGILDSLCVINPNRRVDPTYLFWTLSSDYLVAQYGPTLRGAALPQLSVGRVRSLKIILPPKDEQPKIVQHLERETGKVENAISIKQDQIAALKEYKTSLINAAVTGKIKVI